METTAEQTRKTAATNFVTSPAYTKTAAITKAESAYDAAKATAADQKRMDRVRAIFAAYSLPGAVPAMDDGDVQNA